MSHFLHVVRVEKHTDMRETHAKLVCFSHVRVFFYSCNVQKRATKSDTSGHCLGGDSSPGPAADPWLLGLWSDFHYQCRSPPLGLGPDAGPVLVGRSSPAG